MNYQHKDLADGRWAAMTLLEQMTNIGSEVDRAFNWKNKKNETLCLKSVDRALELIDLSLSSTRDYSSLKELARTREQIADYFYGINEYQVTEAALRKYFLYFGLALRKNL